MTAEPLELVSDLVLASASPRRLELLASLGLRIDVMPSSYPEYPIPGASPKELALRHAVEKTREVAERIPDRLVVGADTVVDIDGEALGKPRDLADATRMLRRLSGRRHAVHTAFALAYRGREFQARETTNVQFFPLTDAEIATYTRTAEPFDKAGSYGIQGRGAIFVERIEGDFYTVMGFPLARFARSLEQVGLCLAPPAPRRYVRKWLSSASTSERRARSCSIA